MFDEVESSSMRPVLKILGLIALGLLLSFILALALDALTDMQTPGWYVAKKLFSEGEDTNIGLLGVSAIGFDWLGCFAILVGAYLLIVQGKRSDSSH